MTSGGTSRPGQGGRRARSTNRLSLRFQTCHSKPSQMFNNIKNNSPMIGENGQFLITLLVLIFLGIVFYMNHDMNYNDINIRYKINFYFEIMILNVIYKLIFPIIYLLNKKDVRTFMWKELFRNNYFIPSN